MNRNKYDGNYTGGYTDQQLRDANIRLAFRQKRARDVKVITNKKS